MLESLVICCFPVLTLCCCVSTVLSQHGDYLISVDLCQPSLEVLTDLRREGWGIPLGIGIPFVPLAKQQGAQEKSWSSWEVRTDLGSQKLGKFQINSWKSMNVWTKSRHFGVQFPESFHACKQSNVVWMHAFRRLFSRLIAVKLIQHYW